jgi:Ran-binding protein 3
VTTGEEEEETLYQVRGKLFMLDETNQWKERGTGQFRLNVRSADGAGARLGLSNYPDRLHARADARARRQ